MKTRRNFLLDCSVTLLGATLIPQQLNAWFTPLKVMALDDLHFSSFAPHVRTVFQVGYEARQLDLELIDATERMGTADADERDEQFSLVFRGSKEVFLPQGVYTFTHPQIGRFDLFIVPVVSRDQSTFTYQAIFNRQRPLSGPASDGRS
jgi:hypothetical protein